MKIQLESESDSPDTASPDRTSSPSRLVNMHLHDSDLVKQKETKDNSVCVIKKIDTPTIVTSHPADTSAATIDDDSNLDALVVDIASDYAVATLGAVATTASSDATDSKDKLSIAIEKAHAHNPIDEVAQTAAESIASIRAATSPEDTAAQINSLRDFTNRIKKDASLPGINELTDTLEQFIAIAEKSTHTDDKAKTEAKAKVTPAAPTNKSVKKKIATKRSTPVAKSATAARPAMKPVKSHAVKNRKAVKPSKSAADDVAIKNAMRKVATMDEPPRARKVRRRGSVKRFLLAFSCSVTCVAAIIYFVGSNIPDISVRVAAMQTGVEASYPSYVPREFSLEDIKSEQGKITLTFSSADNQKFVLIEEKSAWDSTALQRNYVTESWGDDFSTTHEQGITIYIHNSSAAWVNGGVLYKINAESGVLTKKQLRNIVTSM